MAYNNSMSNSSAMRLYKYMWHAAGLAHVIPLHIAQFCAMFISVITVVQVSYMHLLDLVLVAMASLWDANLYNRLSLHLRILHFSFFVVSV